MDQINIIKSLAPGESFYDTATPKMFIKTAETELGEFEYLLYEIVNKEQIFYGTYHKNEVEIMLQDAINFDR
jgi:hypothetical protein